MLQLLYLMRRLEDRVLTRHLLHFFPNHLFHVSHVRPHRRPTIDPIDGDQRFRPRTPMSDVRTSNVFVLVSQSREDTPQCVCGVTVSRLKAAILLTMPCKVGLHLRGQVTKIIAGFSPEDAPFNYLKCDSGSLESWEESESKMH